MRRVRTCLTTRVPELSRQTGPDGQRCPVALKKVAVLLHDTEAFFNRLLKKEWVFKAVDPAVRRFFDQRMLALADDHFDDMVDWVLD